MLIRHGIEWFVWMAICISLVVSFKMLVKFINHGFYRVPVIIDLLINRKKRRYIIKWSVMFGVLLAVPLIVTDTLYYGKIVIAPLNIVLYNVFSSHGANLYGTEPWTFYFLNLTLNFNLALISSAASLPVLVSHLI